MALVFLTGSAVSTPWLLVVLVGLPFIGMLMTADLEALTKLAAEAVKDAMNAAHITDEQAAWHMDIQVGQLRRQLRAEPGAHISFARLLLMPMSFWLHFGPTVLFVVARRAYRQISEDVAARRVE